MSNILVISKSFFDETTNDICCWFDFHKIPYVRLNIDQINNPKLYDVFIDFQSEKIIITDILLNLKVNLDEIEIVWCRRFIDQSSESITKIGGIIDHNAVALSKFIFAENNKFLRILFDFYPNWKWYDYYKDILSVEKIQVLKIAKKTGLTIPETYITNNQQALQNIGKDLITKPIYEATSFTAEKGGIFVTHTKKVSDIKTTGKNFSNSLFQEEIKKRFEIRVFFLEGKFYSMAIFSNKNKHTKVDFRNYDFKRPNRKIPYQLPQKIEDMLKKLMNELHLTMGSIDLIKSYDNQYYFLEVNPVGQFGMVSYPCNYFIEEELVLHLKSKLHAE
jgi:ATP-GRASP peptide maturase of grasp-with-spasm system